MKRILLILIVIALAAAAYFGYQKLATPEASEPAKPLRAGSAEEANAAAPDMPVGEACNTTCPDGKKLEILCAQGETPQCDCAANPQTQCVPAAAAPAP